MQILVLFHCLYFWGQTDGFIVVGPQLFFFVEVGKLQYPLCADHKTLDSDDLSQNPLYGFTYADQIKNNNAVLPASLGRRPSQPYHHPYKHEN